MCGFIMTFSYVKSFYISDLSVYLVCKLMGVTDLLVFLMRSNLDAAFLVQVDCYTISLGYERNYLQSYGIGCLLNINRCERLVR